MLVGFESRAVMTAKLAQKQGCACNSYSFKAIPRRDAQDYVSCARLQLFDSAMFANGLA
jgi:hypothetical protein